MANPKFRTHIGGQAVLEGVMMRGRENYVVAVRKPNKEIVFDERAVPAWSKKYTFLRWPLFRGVLAMAEAVALAVKAISFSAKESVDEDIEITGREMAISMTLGFALAISLFFVLPVVLTRSATGMVPPGASSWSRTVGMNLVEGVIRLGIFFAYLVLVSRLKDIQRIFQYHGAEHKTIHAYEHGVELEPGNVSEFSTKHLRCGTSFLLIVMLVSIFVFMFLGRPDSILTRIGLRLTVLPLVAGISYEAIKYAGRHEESRLVNIVMAPGLFLQRLTTREPSLDQIEVAICSLKKVLSIEGDKSGELIESQVK